MVLVTSCYGDMVAIFLGSQGICQARCLCLCVHDPTGGTQEQGPTGGLGVRGCYEMVSNTAKKGRNSVPWRFCEEQMTL